MPVSENKVENDPTAASQKKDESYILEELETFNNTVREKHHQKTNST